jgi:hypothetical protein
MYAALLNSSTRFGYNSLQLAQTEIEQLRRVTIRTLFSTSESYQTARSAEQKKSDETNAYLSRQLKPDQFWHSQHWKCVEVKVR